MTGCLVWYHSQQHACTLGRRVRRTAAGAAQRCTAVCNSMDKGRTTPGHDVQGCPGWSCAVAVASDCAYQLLPRRQNAATLSCAMRVDAVRHSFCLGSFFRILFGQRAGWGHASKGSNAFALLPFYFVATHLTVQDGPPTACILAACTPAVSSRECQPTLAHRMLQECSRRSTCQA